MKYRKRPVVIEAVQYTGDNWQEIVHLVGYDNTTATTGRALIIKTLEGEHRASPGDWIIKGVKGEFYPCKPDIFALTYEPVPEAPMTGEADPTALAAEIERLRDAATPGEWHSGPMSATYLVTDSQGENIAHAYGGTWQRRAANGQLIAAAPTLLTQAAALLREYEKQLRQLLAYTESCEGLLNASPSGQVLQARAVLNLQRERAAAPKGEAGSGPETELARQQRNSGERPRPMADQTSFAAVANSAATNVLAQAARFEYGDVAIRSPRFAIALRANAAALRALAVLIERAEWIVNDNNITLALSDKLVRELAAGYTAPEGE